MQNMTRRRLFKLAGASSVIAAGAALPVVGRIATENSDVFAFRATLGLPESPLPSYVTYVIEGTFNLAAQTGLVTSRVLAGHPGAPSEIGLPGLTRVIRVIGIDQRGSHLTVQGVVEDRSQLQAGESAHVEFLVDRAHGTIQAPFVGHPVTLALV
jgi:hypothetical protein